MHGGGNRFEAIVVFVAYFPPRQVNFRDNRQYGGVTARVSNRSTERFGDWICSSLENSWNTKPTHVLDISSIHYLQPHALKPYFCLLRFGCVVDASMILLKKKGETSGPGWFWGRKEEGLFDFCPFYLRLLPFLSVFAGCSSTGWMVCSAWGVTFCVMKLNDFREFMSDVSTNLEKSHSKEKNGSRRSLQ